MKIKQLFETMATNNVFFHVTKKSNLSRIQSIGLVPSKGERTNKLMDQQGIYLFPDIDSVEDALMNWMGDEFDEAEDLVILKVRIQDPSLLTQTTGWEFVYSSTIPPLDIQVFRFE